MAKGLYDIPATLTPADYLEFQLYKTITYDENTAATPTESNGSTVEFKNKEGQVVLKRTYETSVKHDTYYVYDQYGNLTFVIPPLVDTSSTITQTILDGLCYQYKYDYRNRLVEKKLPGKQWEFIVYDKLDRPVATGPAFSPFGDSTIGWLITKYDVYSRVVYTGWYESTVTASTRTSLQNDQNSLTTINYETKTSSGTIDSITAYYTNTVVPTSFKLLTANYYDDYAFPTIPSIPTNIEGQNVLTNAKSLPTGTWVRALISTTATAGETATTFYDTKARPIRIYLTNYLGGYTYTDTNLDFSGVAQYTKTYHKRLAGDAELKTTEVFTYSAQGHLLTHTHQINSLPVQLLAENSYDELGQLISKNVGNTTATPLQKVDYAYNIRGWLIGINNDPTNNLVLNTSEKDLFAFKINYNSTEGNVASVKSLYNGNISETYYRTGSDNVLRKYGYQYDNLNRLKNAIYQKPGGNTYPTYEDYSEKNITYDKNGNIQTLYRNGDVIDALPANCIDNLSYFYETNTNKLVRVSDSSNNTSGYKDKNKYGVFHTYDANGNLKTDKNKDINSITYNHLNLPTLISVIVNTSVPKIFYIYNANGVKLNKTYTSGTRIRTTNTTDYLGGFQYYNNVLQYFPTSEGYVKNTAGIYTYVYNYTDHLGNVRLSYGLNANVLTIFEENNYYPFGLKHKGYNDYTPTNYKYKFQGQERQDELGLNWDSFKWRNYDPAIGRFMCIDPLAEDYNYQSPYNFAENRVIDGRELEGLEWASVKNNDGTTTRQLTVQMVNNSSLTDNQVSRAVTTMQSDFAENFSGEGSTAKLVVESISSSDGSCDFLVPLVDTNANTLYDSSGEVIGKTYAGGQTGELGQTQKNSFEVTATVDGSKRSNSDMSRSFSHEAGHTAGLEHPWSSTNAVSDAKQGASGVTNGAVRSNLMNSDQNTNVGNRSTSGTDLTSGQLKSVDTLIEKQQKPAQ